MLCTSFEYYVSNLRSGYQVALGAVVGLTIPSAVTWFKGSMITYALAVTMLGMGLGLDASDFKSAITSPRVILTGVALQYTVMPFLAFALSRALPIPTPFAVGLILVGCCPGGTASNLVTYIARADVALSVVLTACSTALAAVATPALTSALAGQLVPVPAASLVVSTAQARERTTLRTHNLANAQLCGRAADASHSVCRGINPFAVMSLIPRKQTRRLFTSDIPLSGLTLSWPQIRPHHLFNRFV